MKTKLEFPSFLLGDRNVASADIRELSYEQFVSIARAAQEMTQPATMDGRVLRARMAQQVDYFDADGKKLTLTIEDLLKMPFPVARKIQARLQDDESKAGKIIGEGDGVSKALRYELGTPIPIANKEPILELEFLASTYGELEDVISGQDQLEQTLALLRLAKPVHESLQSLPSWAVSAITLADGVTIAQLVLPRFLEE